MSTNARPQDVHARRLRKPTDPDPAKTTVQKKPMMAITELNWNVIEKVLEHAFTMHRPRPLTLCGTYPKYMSEPLLSVALTCREWSQLVRQLLAREEWFKWAYMQSLRLIRHWQKMGSHVFIRLSPDPERNIVDDRVGDLNAVDVPGTAAYFARAVFNLSNNAIANDDLCTDRAAHFARFQIRDEEAMETFLVTLQHDMLQLMERALLFTTMWYKDKEPDGYMNKPVVKARALLGSICCNVNPSPQSLSSFLGNLRWDDFDGPLPSITTPDVGVSLDAQLRIVAALAHCAGIAQFDADFTKLAWWILFNRAAQLIQFASMIATSGLDPDGHAPQFDDDELSDSGGPSNEYVYDSADESDSDYEPAERDEEEGDEEEGDSDSDSGYGTHKSDDDEDEEQEKTPPSRDMVDVAKERAAKRRRTCRFDPVLHDGANIPHEWHFKTRYYIISPSAKCFRWAYERM